MCVCEQGFWLAKPTVVRLRASCPHPEGEGLQDVSLHSGGQQDDSSLWTVLVPVHINALTLQQLQTALVWKDLCTQTHA